MSAAPTPPERDEGAQRRALVAVGVFAAVTIVALIGALLLFAARHR